MKLTDGNNIGIPDPVTVAHHMHGHDLLLVLFIGLQLTTRERSHTHCRQKECHPAILCHVLALVQYGGVVSPGRGTLVRLHYPAQVYVASVELQSTSERVYVE